MLSVMAGIAGLWFYPRLVAGHDSIAQNALRDLCRQKNYNPGEFLLVSKSRNLSDSIYDSTKQQAPGRCW